MDVHGNKMPAAREWEPGDPLYVYGQGLCINPIYDVRIDSPFETGEPGPDAARWPKPFEFRDVTKYDTKRMLEQMGAQ